MISRAVERLREGGLVAFPTETVYGLGANALDAEAVRRVFALKGRPSNNPMIVHVSGPEMARRVVSSWPRSAGELAERFWPGPLTLLLPRAPELPDEVTAGSPLVAVRCPDHPLALELLTRADLPLVGPSANQSGHVSPTRAEHVRADFPELMVLDGGPCRVGLESTVLRLDPPQILRPGAVTAQQLEPITGPLQPASEGPVLHSPGRLERHYAPRTPALRCRRSEFPPVEGRLAVLAQPPLPPAEFALAMPVEAPAYAAALYDRLREADALGADGIVILEPEGEDPLWDAIRDRIRRATK